MQSKKFLKINPFSDSYCLRWIALRDTFGKQLRQRENSACNYGHSGGTGRYTCVCHRCLRRTTIRASICCFYSQQGTSFQIQYVDTVHIKTKFFVQRSLLFYNLSGINNIRYPCYKNSFIRVSIKH